MGPYQNLLVPVDFTEKNQAALATAAELASENGSVTLLHVIEAIEGDSNPELDTFLAELEDAARQKMGAMASSLADRSFSVHPQIVFGRRGQTIVQFAIDHATDLLVLSSHKIDPQNPLAAWGTLSYQVATVAPCQVLLVK